ncbi:DUF2218 domain-containing protein [Bartonella tamiae]|uniref:DUF2218 domain-containing protein n=1 Tax=Bartonella tamiae Th239 TaxID=1094558 RepID=J1JWX2_9HYPH|nr:DUF2218 domain-containing protein [Bartonella tamiae]EJF89095.1 hypothetical protein ME5_01646 [Bartonella tamiae Th239]EJF94655.1 hypothetical protein MEG_00236 [Bartonella tamiae Th307]
MAIQSRTLIQTDHASKYLQQLAKHWSHKLADLTFDETTAHIPFRQGVILDMFANKDALEVQFITTDEDDALKMEGVFDRHLERFAFRETLHIDWHRKTLA